MATHMTKDELSRLADAFYNKIRYMTNLEIHQLTKSMAKATGYAAAPVIKPAAPVEEEKDSFKVILKSQGTKKIDTIKVVRNLLGLSLGDSKRLVEATPSVIKEEVYKNEADNIKEMLESLGAEVEIV